MDNLSFNDFIKKYKGKTFRGYYINTREGVSEMKFVKLRRGEYYLLSNLSDLDGFNMNGKEPFRYSYLLTEEYYNDIIDYLHIIEPELKRV